MISWKNGEMQDKSVTCTRPMAFVWKVKQMWGHAWNIQEGKDAEKCLEPIFAGADFCEHVDGGRTLHIEVRLDCGIISAQKRVGCAFQSQR